MSNSFQYKNPNPQENDLKSDFPTSGDVMLVNYPLIQQINDPEMLKGMTIEGLTDLSNQIRQFIIDNVFKTGGHLASNLGAIELTVALHYVFNFLKDTLVLDVSHQSYPHKILTGRAPQFHTLRQQNGISGFTDPAESPYDVFKFGHAGTSLSTSLGMAFANQLQQEDSKVVALIGDASISTGIAFEALNHAAQLKSDIIVVLNDNKMSIEQTVGSLANHLNRLRVGQVYKDLKGDVLSMLNRFPRIGKNLEHRLRGVKEFIKHMILDEQIFELLGFKYFGPVDGHNLNDLIPIIQGIKDMKMPRILHVITEKGNGHKEAMNDPAAFHGIQPINLKDKAKDPLSSPGTISFTDSFGQSIVQLAHQNKRIVAITAAMPGGTGLQPFAKTFPDRFFDMGISEEHAVAFAAGLAKKGFIPVVAIYSTFIQRAFDQLFQEVSLQNLPVVFVLDRAGLVGEDGPTHHGIFDLSFIRPLPNFEILSPDSGAELSQMLEYAINNRQNPTVIRYPKEKTLHYPQATLPPLERGKCRILREGKDGALIALGPMALTCLEAASLLKQEHQLDMAVINARFVKPIDKDIIHHYREQNLPLFTVEDHALMGGFGSAVLEAAADFEDYSTSKIIRLGIPDYYIEHGQRSLLLKSIRLDSQGIAESVRHHLKLVEH